MTDRVDIAEPINEICERLGLAPKRVGRLDIKPGHLTATVYRVNDKGDKYLDDTGEPAVETREFDVIA